MDKFEAFYDHRRKLVGRRFDSRTLSVGMLDYKKDQLRELLEEWQSRSAFELLDISRLLGILENHTRYARWARCWFASLQNAVRRILFQRLPIINRIYSKKARAYHFTKVLPGHLASRVENLIAKEHAQLLWATRQRFRVGSEMRAAIGQLLAYVSDTADPWEVPLGMIVPRDPHLGSRGDACLLGGGAYSADLRYWFDLEWNPRIVWGAKRLHPSDPGYVHINCLEFIIVILQLAALRVRLDTMDPEDLARTFPSGIPAIPVWLGETDNMVSKSWENKATARTSQGQGLVSVYAELLCTTNVNTQCKHLAGTLNVVADDISRNDFSLPFSTRCSQLFHKHPCLVSLDFFLPSPELKQLLILRLFSEFTPVPCVLPPVLGQFVPAGSTISTSVIL